MVSENEISKQALCCPVCNMPLQDITECSSCNIKFEKEDGVISYIPKNSVKEFKFVFPQKRSQISYELLDKHLKEPPISKSKDNLPYHVDLAHAKIFEELKQGSKILEIGCGGGQNRKWFKNKGFEYIGTDISQTRVPEWLRKYGGPDILCDTHFLPFQDNYFDVVYCA
ncbi:class I SAM-dependent methyltransferase, partial [Candidatus Woesearchaeota archaeon]|nr:class I SAM-dependent methyltransferase [Candidatus Woesearchaeota archaeon]